MERIFYILIILCLAGTIGFLALEKLGILSSRSEGEMIEIKFISSKEGPYFKINSKVADSYASKEKGLMFVKEMPLDEGMIFLYNGEKVRNMWMRLNFLYSTR